MPLDLTSAMQTALASRTSSDSISRNRTIVFEVYDTNYLPTAGQFDPADAVVLWAKIEFTWLGNLYDRRIVSHSNISKYYSGKFDNITLTIENADRYFSEFLLTHDVNGMRLVVRYINTDYSSSIPDSVVCFVGRLQAPEGADIDREQGDITAKEELASLDIEIPKRKVNPDDSVGRSPNDPLFDGFRFAARPSSVKFVETEISRKFFFLLKKKEVIKYNQWSSQSGAEDQTVPLIFGRVQMSGIPVFWVDIGFYIVGIWVFSGHKITSITSFQLPDQHYIFYGWWSDETHRQTHVHLGDPGGTGTNASADTIENTYPQNTALLSRTGYCGFAIGGPESESQPFANPQMDDVPNLVAIVQGEVDLPDGDGVFNQKGFSDSPVYIARFVLTSPDLFGLETDLIYDGELPAVHAERTKPIQDKSNGELLFMPINDQTAASDGTLDRYTSSGLLSSKYFKSVASAGDDPLITPRTDIFSIGYGTQDAVAGGDTPITSGVSIPGQSVAQGVWNYYYITIPLGAILLDVAITVVGNGVLYMQPLTKPTISFTPGPTTATETNPAAGVWWIGVHGNAGGATYSILATVTGGIGSPDSGVAQSQIMLRRAYTFNAPLTDTVNASDFLNDVVLSTGRLYKVYDSAGRIRIRAKKASDSTYLISDANGGASATGTITINTVPADGDFVVVHGVTWTFRNSPSNQYEVQIGSTVNITTDTLVGMLNGSSHSLLVVATYANSGSGVLTITHQQGTAGNSFTLAKTSSHITLSGSTLSGGLNGDTSIGIANVEPWRASAAGFVLISVGLVTSETRAITGAVYDSTTGNAITLAVSGTGLVRSGATLTGGNSTTPSSGTVSVNSLASAGTLLTVTVWGIPITYTVLGDDVNSIAGNLAALINADPNLRQYVRAVWDEAHLVTIYSTVGTLSFTDPLLNDHVSQIDSPVTAPTASSVTSGTLTPGDYYVGYSFVDGSGNETLISPLTKVTIASGHKVSVTSPSLPSGASEFNWYFSPAPNDDHVQFLLTNSGGTFTINIVSDYDADFPAGLNTTGGETIRVAEVFTSRNTRKDSMKWSPSRSKINQVSGTFVDAVNGFRRQPITVNDLAHQRAVRQINKVEINLSGVDNFSQASRLCHARLAEERDAGTRWSWATDDAGIFLEVGDVVAINEYQVNELTLQTEQVLVNQPVIIEETNLSQDCDVSFVGVVYSSALLEGQTGRKPIVIASTLKYFTDPPPVASNLILTQSESFLTGILVDFDFGTWAHTQLAHVFMKGPSFVLPAVEPSDSTYKLIDTIYPDGNNHGHTEIRATSAGTYWIRVVTQSAFGQSAASGHPADSILIRPAAPVSVLLEKLAGNDRILSWQPAVEGAFLPETYVIRVRDSGSNALKRTATVVANEGSLPAKWTYQSGAGDQSKVTISGDGSIVAAASTTAVLIYISQLYTGDGDVEIETDDRLFIEAQIINNGSGHAAAEVLPASGDPQSVDAGTATWQRRRLHPKTKLAFRIRNGTVEYRYNDAFWAVSTAFEAIESTFYLRVTFDSEVGDPYNFDQAYLRVRFVPTNARQWAYSDGMAKEDFSGSNPSTVKFEVTQISSSGIESLPATVTG